MKLARLPVLFAASSLYAASSLAACAGQPAPQDDRGAMIEASAVQASPERDRTAAGEDTIEIICQGRTPCIPMTRMELSAPGGVVQEIALHDRGEQGRRPDLEHCAPFEYWLLPDGEPPLKLIEVCNDGYGASMMGEDQVQLDGDRLIYRQSGGSNWRWSNTYVIDLVERRLIEEHSRSFWTMGSNVEVRQWDWRYGGGFVHWMAPICDAREVAEPHLDMHDIDGTGRPTFRYDTLPQLQLPRAFREGRWRDTSLGDCGIEVNAQPHPGGVDGKGFVIHGAPGTAEEARVRAVLASPQELYVEVIDPTWNIGGDSWLHEDHLEIWVGPRQSYAEACLEPAEPRQWGISLHDGTVYPAHGSPPAEALRVKLSPATDATDSDQGERIFVRIEFEEPPQMLTVVYSDSFEGLRQDRLIASSALEYGQAASLGQTREIPDHEAGCVFNDRALRYEDRRDFEVVPPH